MAYSSQQSVSEAMAKRALVHANDVGKSLSIGWSTARAGSPAHPPGWALDDAAGCFGISWCHSPFAILTCAPSMLHDVIQWQQFMQLLKWQTWMVCGKIQRRKRLTAWLTCLTKIRSLRWWSVRVDIPALYRPPCTCVNSRMLMGSDEVMATHKWRPCALSLSASYSVERRLFWVASF